MIQGWTAHYLSSGENVGLTKKICNNEISHLDLPAFFKNRFSGIQILKPPVFIVGCGHSGTTMFRHVLGLHQNIYAVPYEGRIFFHSNIKIRIADAIWSFTAISKGKTRWLEKTPSHIYHLDRIFQIYPDSRVLLLIRDGRDVAVSLNRRWGDFGRSVRKWVEDNRAGEPYWGHPMVKKVLYEQLVSDFERQMKAVCTFIDEPFDNTLLSFSDRSSTAQLNDEISNQNGAKPKEFRDKQIAHGLYNANGRWIAEMTEEQREIFKRIAGDMLIEYGYAEDSSW